MNHDVFISYSSKNSTAAQAICHELEDSGIKCWIAPRDIPVGSKYASVINQAIIHCKVVVLVFSDYSARSPWVESEINIAFSNRKVIIPYKIDKTNFEDFDEFYLMLNNRHWIEAYPDYKTRFKDLVTVVGQNVGPVSPLPPKPTTPSKPNLFKKSWNLLKEYWWVALCAVVMGVLGYYSNPKQASNTDNTSETAYQTGINYWNSKNYDEAVNYFRTAAELGHANAQFEFGYAYWHGQGLPQDYDEAVKWILKAAKQGHADAQNHIGYSYKYGIGLPQDYEEAIKWYRKSAKQDNVHGQNNLGNCYYFGQGVKQDYKEAVKWYKKAAEQDHMDAQALLAACYYYGNGIAKDYEEAVKWYSKAAKQGNASAQYNLGVCYENGDGVEKDINKAIELYQQSAKLDYQPAHEALTRLGRIPNEIN